MLHMFVYATHVCVCYTCLCMPHMFVYATHVCVCYTCCVGEKVYGCLSGPSLNLLGVMTPFLHVMAEECAKIALNSLRSYY